MPIGANLRSSHIVHNKFISASIRKSKWTVLISKNISPGGLFTLNFVRLSAEDINLAVALLCLFSLLSVLVPPLLAYLLLGKTGELSSFFWLIIHLGLLIAFPLYVSRLLTDFLPNGQHIAIILGIVSIITFISFDVLTSNIKSNALHILEWNALGIIVLLVLSGWILGWLFAGRRLEDIKVMAISTSMRNVAFCYPLALSEFAHTNVILPSIAFSGISIVMNMELALGLKLRDKYGRAN